MSTRQIKSERTLEGPAKHPPIIIVSGLPRSGTSMLMQMLEAGGVPILSDAVRPPDSSNPRGYYELERVKRLHREADKSWLSEGWGKAVKIISFLLPHLPDSHSYQLIFMKRSLHEIVASQNQMLASLSQLPGNENEDGLLESYESHLTEVRSFLESRPWFVTLDVNYRDVLDAPAREAARLARFLERDLDTASMTRVVEPQLYRNRSG